jgi:hypothetical protein
MQKEFPLDSGNSFFCFSGSVLPRMLFFAEQVTLFSFACTREENDYYHSNVFRKDSLWIALLSSLMKRGFALYSI